MNFLNSQQLAFILDIKREDARARMCNAWEKEKGIQKDTNANKFDHVHGAKWNEKNKIVDQYPQAMSIELLERGLNMPHLQAMVMDINQNYLTRSASKKYILFEYPEKVLIKARNDGKAWPVRIDLPPALKSLLPSDTVAQIHDYWRSSFTYVKDGETLPKLVVK